MFLVGSQAVPGTYFSVTLEHTCHYTRFNHKLNTVVVVVVVGARAVLLCIKKKKSLLPDETGSFSRLFPVWSVLRRISGRSVALMNFFLSAVSKC